MSNVTQIARRYNIRENKDNYIVLWIGQKNSFEWILYTSLLYYIFTMTDLFFFYIYVFFTNM